MSDVRISPNPTQQHPADNLYLQHQAAKQRGDKGAAARLLESGLQVGPERPACWYGLGVHLFDDRNIPGAVAGIKRALRKIGRAHV